MLLLPEKNNRPSHKVKPIEAENNKARLMPLKQDNPLRG
jgi:hypothetical protein